MKRRPRLYFSLRSPYSWLSLRRLRAVLPDLDEQVDWIPYWDPDPITDQALKERGAEFHYVQMTKAKHLYILADTKRLTERLRVRMAWPIDIDPWWEVPHLAWLAARRQGAARRFYDAVTAARWERGENICDPQVLRRVTTEAGLDGTALAAATEDPAIRAEGVDCLVSAYEDDVFGIPYFRVGRHRFWGFDRVEGFLDVLLPALGRDRAAGPDPEDDPLARVPDRLRSLVGSYDTDTAGGCG